MSDMSALNFDVQRVSEAKVLGQTLFEWDTHTYTHFSTPPAFLTSTATGLLHTLAKCTDVGACM